MNHPGKDGKPDSVKTMFMCGLTSINKWYAPESGGRARADAHKFWHAHGGRTPFPKTAIDWIERQGELSTTEEIFVVPAGKFWNVESYRVGAANDNGPAAANDNKKGYAESWEMDDVVPF